MTHEELHALLPEYAAGTLDVEASEAVRAHLAGGCLECLNDVFVRPVGLPRSAPPPAPAPAPRPAPPEPRARRGRALEAAVVVLALAVAAGMAWTIAELRGREAAYRAQAVAAASQLAETEAVRRDLAARVPALERDADSARTEAARQAAAIRETAEASARVQNELDAAHERIETLLRGIRRRDGEIDRLLQSFDGDHALRGLLATPGMEVLPLKPVAPFRDVRGQVLWHPSSDTVLVYAFGLPPLAARSAYRIRVALDDGREIPGPPFRLDSRSDVAVPLRLDAAGARLKDVEVVIDPAAQPVLAGRRASNSR